MPLLLTIAHDRRLRRAARSSTGSWWPRQRRWWPCSSPCGCGRAGASASARRTAMQHELAAERRPLPVGSTDGREMGWWGMMTVIATEASLFGYLLFGYYYFAAQFGRAWLPDELPEFRLSLPNTVILIAQQRNRVVGGTRHLARARGASGRGPRALDPAWRDIRGDSVARMVEEDILARHQLLRLVLFRHHGFHMRMWPWASCCWLVCWCGRRWAGSTPAATRRFRSPLFTGTSWMSCGSPCSSHTTSRPMWCEP